MKNAKGKIRAGFLIAGAMLLALGACAGNDSNEDTLLSAVVLYNQQQADTIAENLVLKLSGMIIPEEKSSTTAAMSAKTVSRNTRALTCVDGVCNGTFDCPSGGTAEYVNLAATSSNSVSGTVTTSTSSLNGRQISNACAVPQARIVNGVLDGTRTVTTSGTSDISSFTRTSTTDSATGMSTDVVNAVYTFTGLSIDGSTPVDGSLNYQADSTWTVSGQAVSTTLNLNYTGTVNGQAVSGSRTYQFEYTLP